jgi:hypothetical protein
VEYFRALEEEAAERESPRACGICDWTPSLGSSPPFSLLRFHFRSIPTLLFRFTEPERQSNLLPSEYEQFAETTYFLFFPLESSQSSDTPSLYLK